MDEVFIRDLTVQGVIGVNADERKHSQDILINIRLLTNTSFAAQTDNIANCIDYGTMTTRIKEFVEISSRYTLEALAEDIARLCLDHPAVKRVIIRVEKPGVVPGTASVGVQIER